LRMMREPVFIPASPPPSTKGGAGVAAVGGSMIPLLSSPQFTERVEAREQMEAVSGVVIEVRVVVLVVESDIFRWSIEFEFELLFDRCLVGVW